jgi:hypothetical protein
MSTNYSEASFPEPKFWPVSSYPVMSLRDWFAGQAIAGILANPDIAASAARLKVSTEDFRVDTARSAFEVADAMLAERSKAAKP